MSRDDPVVDGAEGVVDVTVYGDDGTVRVDPLVPPDYHPEKAVSVELGGSWGVASVSLDEAEGRAVAAEVVPAVREGSECRDSAPRPGYARPALFEAMEPAEVASELRAIAAHLTANPEDRRGAWDAVEAAVEVWRRSAGVDEAEAPAGGES